MKKTVICQVLTAVLMLLPCAGILRAQGQTVTLDLRDVPLETAMQSIKQQTNYLFVNMNVDTQQPVTAHVDNKGIEAALDAIFAPIHVDWKIEGTTIVIAPKPAQSVQGGPKTVRGRILDANGEPVIGGAVMVKGTTIGASTDLDGNFEFTASSRATPRVAVPPSTLPREPVCCRAIAVASRCASIRGARAASSMSRAPSNTAKAGSASTSHW